MARLATTAYTLGRSHTCSRCEYSNIPCNETPEPKSPSVADLQASLLAQKQANETLLAANHILVGRINRMREKITRAKIVLEGDIGGA